MVKTSVVIRTPSLADDLITGDVIIDDVMVDVIVRGMVTGTVTSSVESKSVDLDELASIEKASEDSRTSDVKSVLDGGTLSEIVGSKEELVSGDGEGIVERAYSDGVS